jgi:hypothetical protein
VVGVSARAREWRRRGREGGRGDHR